MVVGEIPTSDLLVKVKAVVLTSGWGFRHARSNLRMVRGLPAESLQAEHKASRSMTAGSRAS